TGRPAVAPGVGPAGPGVASGGTGRSGDGYRGAAPAGAVRDLPAGTAATDAVVPRERRRKTGGGGRSQGTPNGFGQGTKRQASSRCCSPGRCRLAAVSGSG